MTDAQLLKEWQRISGHSKREMEAKIGRSVNYVTSTIWHGGRMGEEIRARVVEIMRLEKLIADKVPDSILVTYELEKLISSFK